MQTIYDGAHSIIFCRKEVFNDRDDFKIHDVESDPSHSPEDFYGGFHTWWSWNLVPASRPFVAPPQQKTSTIDIPGANGVVDLSNVPLGLSTYQNRTGSWEFYIANDVNGETWEKTYMKLMACLHGKELAVILTDDPSYFYTGRITINQFKSDKMNSTITINYDLYPYKRMVWTTLGDWLWDPFDFQDGIIRSQTDYFKDLEVDTPLVNNEWSLTQGKPISLTYTPELVGTEPICPKFIITPSSGVTKEFYMAIHNYEKGNVRYFHLSFSESKNPQIMIACPDFFDKTLILIGGKGYVSIQFRIGRL